MTEPSPITDRGYEQLPIPFGWFAVAMSNEIMTGQVKTLHYFDTELVMWRGVDGALRALDPYCPHLGAHLGVGGQVVGNDLRCPFHHWAFDGDGGVTEIPYSKLVPPKLKRSCQPSWPIEESAGVIYVWYHPKRAEPKWEVAKLPDIGGRKWVESERHEWILHVHAQEVTENSQDHAHFLAVHGTKGPASAEFKIEGWTRRNTVEAPMQTPRGVMQGKIDVTATGPGQSIAHYTDVTEVLMSQQTTPIDHQSTHVRWQLYHPADLSEGQLRVAKARMRDFVKQINQDVPIWNAKVYKPNPILVEGDGPLLAYRQQYARYYQFDEPAPLAKSA